MKFTRIDPPAELRKLVDCYWLVEDANTNRTLQKIIPDGYPEIVFHFGDPYRIKLGNQWELQAASLLAGQITKFFFLENSGASNILGIKLKPTALTQLMDLEMALLTDRVISLQESGIRKLNILDELIRGAQDHAVRINIINEKFLEWSASMKVQVSVEKAIDAILSSNGVITVAAMCEQCKLSERQAERLFKKFIGLSPKFYTRVIRFSNIFQVAQEKKLSWSEVGLEAGFYDQAHFIKDFKEFTGEDPSHYFFDEPNLANFFMKKI